MIARESRGSPYFVYELVEHLNAGGELEDRSSIRGSISLDDVLWARIERLPEGPRALLEVLAVAGQPLRQADTIRAAGLGPEGFTALASLRRQPPDPRHRLGRPGRRRDLPRPDPRDDRQPPGDRAAAGLARAAGRHAGGLRARRRPDAGGRTSTPPVGRRRPASTTSAPRGRRRRPWPSTTRPRLFRRALELRRGDRGGARPAPRAGPGAGRRRPVARGGPRIRAGLRGRRPGRDPGAAPRPGLPAPDERPDRRGDGRLSRAAGPPGHPHGGDAPPAPPRDDRHPADPAAPRPEVPRTPRRRDPAGRARAAGHRAGRGAGHERGRTGSAARASSRAAC